MFIEIHIDLDPNHVLQCFTVSHTKQACIEQKKKAKNTYEYEFHIQLQRIQK